MWRWKAKISVKQSLPTFIHRAALSWVWKVGKSNFLLVFLSLFKQQGGQAHLNSASGLQRVWTQRGHGLMLLLWWWKRILYFAPPSFPPSPASASRWVDISKCTNTWLASFSLLGGLWCAKNKEYPAKFITQEPQLYTWLSPREGSQERGVAAEGGGRSLPTSSPSLEVFQPLGSSTAEGLNASAKLLIQGWISGPQCRLYKELWYQPEKFWENFSGFELLPSCSWPPLLLILTWHI